MIHAEVLMVGGLPYLGTFAAATACNILPKSYGWMAASGLMLASDIPSVLVDDLATVGLNVSMRSFYEGYEYEPFRNLFAAPWQGRNLGRTSVWLPTLLFLSFNVGARYLDPNGDKNSIWNTGKAFIGEEGLFRSSSRRPRAPGPGGDADRGRGADLQSHAAALTGVGGARAGAFTGSARACYRYRHADEQEDGPRRGLRPPRSLPSRAIPPKPSAA
jgi:hypothetical protein